MTTVIVRSLEGLQQQVIVDGHSLVADEPEAVGGDGLGPTPYDLLLSALGTCTSMTLLLYARRKGWDLKGVEVWLTFDRVHAEDCVTCTEEERAASGDVDQITREFTLIGALDESQRGRLREIARRCPVHRTLSGNMKIVDTEPEVRAD